MQYLCHVVAIFFLTSCSVAQDSELTKLRDRISMENLESHVTALSKMRRWTREGSGREQARSYITEHLSAYGYTVRREPVTRRSSGGEVRNGFNVAARKESSVSGEILVLAAGYASPIDSPGADWNASGVAGLLEVARVCSGSQFNKTIEFVAFDLWDDGSEQYVKNLRDDGARVIACINLDRIGYTQANQTVVVTSESGCLRVTPARVKTPGGLTASADPNRGDFIAVVANAGNPGVTSTPLADIFTRAVEMHVPFLPVVKAEVRGRGDCYTRGQDATPVLHDSRHYSFWKADIPAVWVTDTGPFRNPHLASEARSGDTACSLDFAFHRKVVQATLLTFLDLVQPSKYAAPRQVAPSYVSISDAVPMLSSAFYSAGTEDTADDLVVTSGYSRHKENSIAFWATRSATNQRAVFLVDGNNHESWTQLTEFETASADGSPPPISWTPDDRTFVTGVKIGLSYGSDNRNEMRPLRPYQPWGQSIAGQGSFTHLPTANWYVDAVEKVVSAVDGNIYAMAVNPDGTNDLSRTHVKVTDFDAGSFGTITSVTVAEDGRSLTFVVENAGKSSLYAIPNLSAILKAAPKPSSVVSSLAPSSLTDSSMVALHQFNTSVGAADVSQFRRSAVFVDDCGSRDRDIFVREIHGSGPPKRVSLTGNQGLVTPYMGGSRVICSNVSRTEPRMSLGTLRVTTPIASPTKSAVTIDDGNGTSVTIQPGTTITFPNGAAEEIFIETPARRVDPASLSLNLTGTQVARTIGPYGATFSKPVTVTIRYRDAELMSKQYGPVEILVPFLSRLDRKTGRYAAEQMLSDTKSVEYDPKSENTFDRATKTIVFKTRQATTYVLASGGKLE